MLMGLLTSLALSSLLLTDWPAWRGEQGTGVSTESGWTVDMNSSDHWRRNVGVGYSSPSIADGRCFTKGFDTSTQEDVMICLDAETGEEIWQHRYKSKLWDAMHEGGTLTTPLVDSGRVFVVSRLGTIRCYDAKDGEVIWSRELAQAHDAQTGSFGLCASPIAVDGSIVLNVGPTLSLDPESGEVEWETKNYGYSYGTPMPFTRAEEPALAIFNAVGLVILDGLMGEEIMAHPWTSNYNVNSATPIIVDEKVFISTGYDNRGCAYLDVSGDEVEVIWESKVMRNKMSGCVLWEEHLYGFDDSMLKCIDLAGDENWRHRGLGVGALTVADGHLIVLSESGELLIAKAQSDAFEPRSRTQLFTEGKCWTPPVLANGLIYCRNNRGELVCRDHRRPDSATDSTDS